MLFVDQRVFEIFDVTKCDVVCAIVFSFVVRVVRSLLLSLYVSLPLREEKREISVINANNIHRSTIMHGRNNGATERRKSYPKGRKKQSLNSKVVRRQRGNSFENSQNDFQPKFDAICICSVFLQRPFTLISTT